MKYVVAYEGGSIGFATKREAAAFLQEEADAKFFGRKRSRTAEKHMRDVKKFNTVLGHCGGLTETWR